MPTDHTLRAALLAVFVTILWASSWVLIRIGLDTGELSPIGFAGLRYGLAALVVWATLGPLRRRQIRRLTPSRLGELAVLGIVFYALTQGSQFVAIAHQPAATTSLILSFTPLLTAVVAVFFLGERITPIQIAGMLAVAGGATLYFTGSLGATVVGMTAAVVCLGANTASSVMGRNINRRAGADPRIVTVVSMSVGAVILLIIGAVLEGIRLPNAEGMVIVAWLAVVNTAWAFVLWNRSLIHLPAATSAVINNLMLVEIAVLAWLFLDERPSVGQVVAISVVTVGVVAGGGALGAVRASRSAGEEQQTSPPPTAPDR
ncbi:MAG: DMT family transporter [Acidimicrobiia bacterium]